MRRIDEDRRIVDARERRTARRDRGTAAEGERLRKIKKVRDRRRGVLTRVGLGVGYEAGKKERERTGRTLLVYPSSADVMKTDTANLNSTMKLINGEIQSRYRCA